MVDSGWLVLFSDASWMVTVISLWALDGYCYFLVGSGWLLLFSGWLWMVTVIFWWALEGYCYFLVGFGWCGPTENTVSIDTASHLYV